MQTGTQLSEIGFDVQSTTTPATEALQRTASTLAPTLSSYNLHLMSKTLGVMPLTIAKNVLSLDWFDEAIDSLVWDIDKASREQLCPTDKERIIKAVGVVAEVLQVELPSAPALRIYADVLSEIPTCCWAETCSEVLRTHKYNTLPKPASFLEAAAPLVAGAQATRNLLEHTKKKIEMAREIWENINGN